MRAYRLANDITFRDFAKLLGMSVETIRRIERSEGTPWDRTAAKIERVIAEPHLESEQLP